MKLAVVISAGHDFPDKQVTAAAQLATALDAPITGIITTEQGIDYYPMDDGGFADVAAATIEDAERRINVCVDAFKTKCAGLGLAQEWYGRHGFIQQAWPSLSPYFDLAVVTSPLSAAELANAGIAATLQLHNDSVIGSFDKRCVIAWDGSMASGRAVRAAMPLLRRFAQVEVIMVDAKRRSVSTDIGSYLAANGITATISSDVSGDDTVAGLIMAQANGADLLVMGAYGGSVIFERLFGGVTESIQADCKTPVLYAH